MGWGQAGQGAELTDEPTTPGLDVELPEFMELQSQLLENTIAAMGGEKRQGQVDMATAVAKTIANNEHLLVQAGTGTGKSLAYLVPAAAWVLSTGGCVVISTATLALQHQIVHKDAPVVKRVITATTGRDVSIKVLKGWSNYGCLAKAEGDYPLEDDAPQLELDRYSNNSYRSSLSEQVQRARSWVIDSVDGDRDEMRPGVDDKAWRQVSTSSLECMRDKCASFDRCFAKLARERASDADIIITNHAILGIETYDLAPLLPDFDALIMDEAHEVVSRVRNQATGEISVNKVNYLARQARSHLGLDTADLEASAQALQTALAGIDDGLLAAGPPEELTLALQSLGVETRAILTKVAELTEADGGDNLKQHAGKKVVSTGAEELSKLSMAMACPANDEQVLWCTRPRQGADPPRLYLAPLEVGGTIATKLLSEHAVVATGATCMVGGSFDRLAEDLGFTVASDAWKNLDVGSPFDYPKQGIMYLAANVPAPGRDWISSQAQAELISLALASNGGMLGLFSSYKGVQNAAELLREATEFEVLVQGEGQLSELVEQFRATPDSCLLGTLSLWQGVDVPGLACRLVVIDRIPFPRPDEPISAALTKRAGQRGQNGFMRVSASHAALLLAQGAGRLIRSSQDRGVVAILDPRIATARYGSYLLKGLPEFWRTTDVSVATSALQRLSQATIQSN